MSLRTALSMAALFALAVVVTGCGSIASAAPSASIASASVTPATTAVVVSPTATEPAATISTSPCATFPGSGFVGLVSPVPQDGPKVLAHADSVWLDGSVIEPNCLVDQLFVWTANDGKTPVIGELALNAMTPSVVARYNRDFTCPRAIGSLTITSVQGQHIRFRSATGVTGSFDFDTRAWSFE